MTYLFLTNKASVLSIWHNSIYFAGYDAAAEGGDYSYSCSESDDDDEDDDDESEEQDSDDSEQPDTTAAASGNKAP